MKNTSITARWAYRQTHLFNLAEGLLRRGLRVSLVQTITGLPFGCCKDLRKEVAPNHPSPRGGLPKSIYGHALSSRRAREAASLFVPPYLALTGEEAKHNVCPRALITAYDMHINACHRIGISPLPIDWAYCIAHCIMDDEELVVQRCQACGGLYVPQANSQHCPMCIRLRSVGVLRRRGNRPKSAPIGATS